MSKPNIVSSSTSHTNFQFDLFPGISVIQAKTSSSYIQISSSLISRRSPENRNGDIAKPVAVRKIGMAREPFVLHIEDLKVVRAPPRTIPIDLEDLIIAIENQNVALAPTAGVLAAAIREAEGGARRDGLLVHGVEVAIFVFVRVFVELAPVEVEVPQGKGAIGAVFDLDLDPLM